MASKKSWGLKGLLAALVAVFVAFAALPGTALAAYTTQRGSITVSNVQPEETVTLYQVVDFTYDEKNNTVDWSFVDGIETLGIDRVAYRDAEDDSDQVKTWANQMASYVLNPENHFPSDRIHEETVPAGATSVTFNNLNDGEYLIVVTPTDGSTRIYQRAIAKLEPVQENGNWTLSPSSSVDMSMKSTDQPPVDKTVDVDGQPQQGPVSNYKPGDKVDFDITSLVPAYPQDAINEHFAISDTMSEGLIFNNDIVVTLIPGKDVEGEPENVPLTLNNEYSLTDGANLNGKTFEIVFNYDKISQYAGWTVQVSYSATIDVKAVAGPIENNQATVEFARDPYVADSFDTDDDEVKLYTYTIQIQKVDADNSAKFLEATFDVRDAEGVSYGTITTDPETGFGTITDLPAGTYYLVETIAPDGYQLDQTPIEVVIDAKANKDADEADLIVSLEKAIENKKTPNLPVTGGAGTIAITATGVVLIAGAAALIVRARRQHNN